MTGHEMTADRFDCEQRNIKKVKFQEVIFLKKKRKTKKLYYFKVAHDQFYVPMYFYIVYC